LPRDCTSAVHYNGGAVGQYNMHWFEIFIYEKFCDIETPS